MPRRSPRCRTRQGAAAPVRATAVSHPRTSHLGAAYNAFSGLSDLALAVGAAFVLAGQRDTGAVLVTLVGAQSGSARGYRRLGVTAVATALPMVAAALTLLAARRRATACLA